MTCSACGTLVQSEARFCSHCGVAAPPPPAYSQPFFLPEQRVQRHVRSLGILWIIYGALPLAGWLIALPFLTFFSFGMPFGHHGPLAHLPWLAGAWIPFVTMILVLMGGASFLVGFGLLRRQPWGRMLAIVMAFWAVIHPVMGTALGIYTLWVLMPASSEWEYRQIEV